MTILEHLNEGDGSIIVGWLAPGVLYSRLEGVISEDLVRRLVRRLMLLMDDASDVAYFTDTSTIAWFDLEAFCALMDALTARRDQFRSIVAFAGQIPRSSRAHT